MQQSAAPQSKQLIHVWMHVWSSVCCIVVAVALIAAAAQLYIDDSLLHAAAATNTAVHTRYRQQYTTTAASVKQWLLFCNTSATQCAYQQYMSTLQHLEVQYSSVCCNCYRCSACVCSVGACCCTLDSPLHTQQTTSEQQQQYTHNTVLLQ
jgi:hypothetical protein